MNKELDRSNRRLRTTPSAANFISLKPGTLSNWRSSSKGPKYLKIGGRIFYDEADLVQWLEDRKINPEKRL